jgi:hypothetical protein
MTGITVFSRPPGGRDFGSFLPPAAGGTERG